MKSFFIDGPHNLIFAFSVLLLIVPVFFFFRYLVHEANFAILTITKVCQQPLNNRCNNVYGIQDQAGHKDNISIEGYIFRDEELLIGNSILKKAFRLKYYLNGKLAFWAFYGGSLMSIVTGLAGIFVWRWYVVLRN